MCAWPDIVQVATFVLLFIGVIAGIRQLVILQTRHRFDTAPFVTIDIEPSTKRKPADVHEYQDEIDEVKRWSKAKRKAPNRYLILRLQNKQSHIGGAAIDVAFRITFRFPKYRTPNTQIEVPLRVTGEIWLETGEIFRIIFINLKGVPTVTVDIDKIEYYDVDRNRYTRTYGYCRWTLDNAGQEYWELISCGK